MVLLLIYPKVHIVLYNNSTLKLIMIFVWVQIKSMIRTNFILSPLIFSAIECLDILWWMEAVIVKKRDSNEYKTFTTKERELQGEIGSDSLISNRFNK